MLNFRAEDLQAIQDFNESTETIDFYDTANQNP